MTTQMLQEIGEASEAVARQLGHNADLLAELGARLRALDPPLVVTIARGSSDCCALYLKYLVEIVSGAPCASIGPSIATLYRAPMRLEGSVSVAISQSGRSPDGGALTVALINDVASLLAGEAEVLLPLCAGRELSVAATKSMVAIEASDPDDAHRLATANVEATLLEPIVMIHRFYRLAEALARRLGRDPDRPRNLRKVTETI
jgi:glucosamine--fructose-6-phosphate aminotransferase (isomerizing)